MYIYNKEFYSYVTNVLTFLPINLFHGRYFSLKHKNRDIPVMNVRRKGCSSPGSALSHPEMIEASCTMIEASCTMMVGIMYDDGRNHVR